MLKCKAFVQVGGVQRRVQPRQTDNVSGLLELNVVRNGGKGNNKHRTFEVD